MGSRHGAVNSDHIMDMPNYEGKELNENPMSVKEFVKEVVRCEGSLLFLGLTAIAIDPLFFYIPIVKNGSSCVELDNTLIIVIVVLRTLVDILHDWLWWSKSFDKESHHSEKEGPIKKLFQSVDRVLSLIRWRARSQRISSFGGRSEVPSRATKWLKRFNISQISSPNGRSSLPARVIAIIASLPFLQVLVLTLDLQDHLKIWLKFGVLCQFVPRIFRTYPTYEGATTSSDMYAWIGAAFNLLLFVLSGHALGGFWYLRAVDRKMDCIEGACRGHLGCTESSLYCKSGNYANNAFLDDICAAQPASNTTIPFDYGIYSDAIKSNLIGSTHFMNKLANGFWWGIKNLSSMGQNLEFSDYIWDTCFAILICVLGLILFALLIGNLQMYLQSKLPYTVAKLKQKREDLQKWPTFHSLPLPLRKEVSMCQHVKWQEVCEVNLESLLNNIPLELKRKLKPYFCQKLFHKVKEFEELDQTIKKELIERAKAVVFQPRTAIHREGYPIYEMIHIVHGKALAYNNNDVREGFPAQELKKDDSFGKELLQRALESRLPKLPLATQTIQSTTKIEAFALSFDDFATIFAKYERLLQPNKREWAVSVITCAFRKKQEKSSQEGKE